MQISIEGRVVVLNLDTKLVIVIYDTLRRLYFLIPLKLILVVGLLVAALVVRCVALVIVHLDRRIRDLVNVTQVIPLLGSQVVPVQWRAVV